MATAAVLTPHDVSTTLNYYVPEGDEAPYRYTYEPPAGKKESNIGIDPKPAVVHDARGRESEFTLDTTGFQFVKHVSSETEFKDEEKIKEVYYKEVEELLKKQTGAKRVLVFDHTIRRNATDTARGQPLRGPVERVHIDQTYQASINRVHHHLPSEASRLLSGRVRLINVWRPIGNPVYHKPLAVSDWRTIDTANDLVPVKFIFPDPTREGGTYSVKYNPQHRWYHLSQQTPEEVVLIKCFDSEEDGRARLTAHTAFWDASSPEEAPQRQSIELRCLVFDTA